jgi:anaerobic magnesium-protoporphyrin IX monomethyl ester cyclase
MPGRFLFIHVNLLASIESPDTIPISESTILAHLQNHGFSGRILGDFAGSPLRPSVVAEAIRKEQPLAVGFTAYQENIGQIRLWARLVKKISPTAKVVLGGPQVTFMPGDALRHMPEIDFLCRGEGEAVMLRLAEVLQEGEDPAHVPGLCLLDEKGEVLETVAKSGPVDLDTFASPYLMDLIDLRCKDRAILLTSRGCSYQCAFCYTPKASGRTVRFHSQERIVDEMKYLKSKGICAFWFADTNFSYSRKRLISLLEAISSQVPGISFWCQTRYDLINKELLVLLRRAGAESVAYGLESANPSVLERINKPIDLERLSSVIGMTHEAGIRAELFSMFALPGETAEQALRTLAFVKKNGVSVEGNSISQQAHLFFGTPLNDDPARFGIRPFRRTKPAYLSVCRDYETEAMSSEEIRKISLVWRLGRTDFVQDVADGKNLFHRASLITENRDALSDRPEALCLLARIYLALEEYAAAVDCFDLLEKRFPDDEAAAGLVGNSIRCFKNTDAAAPGLKVIYDCQGFVNGRVVAATVGRYQEAILGTGALLADFERHLAGMAKGEEAEFEVSFPKYYGQKDLADKKVMFLVRLRQTMRPVAVEDWRTLDPEGLANDYPLEDTDGLRQHNINLYYKTLRSALRQGLVPALPDAFMLINLFLKLGFLENALGLVERLPQNPVVFGHAAHVFRMNGRSAAALAYLDRLGTEGERERLIRAQALFDAGRLEESEAVAQAMGYRNNIPLQELRVQLAERLALPVEIYLEREAVLLDLKTSAML